MVNCIYVSLSGLYLTQRSLVISSSLDHKFMIAYALTLYLLLETLLEAAMQLEAVLAPKFRVLAKGGRLCPFSVFQILFLFNYLLDV